MIKLTKDLKKRLITIAVGFLVTLFFLFSYDFGVMSSYHVKNDFDDMFQKRMTGNCEGFAQRILADRDEWKQKCIDERERSDEAGKPIVGWSIIDISINGDEAFLQVELERDLSTAKRRFAAEGLEFPEEDFGYRVNYQMKKVSYDWYLNQPIES